MNYPASMVDYRDFSFGKLNTPQYRHLWFLLFWPALLLRYILLERWNPAVEYTPVWCPLDDRIPFCEWFLIPYVLWYALLVGMHLYTMFYDVEAFRQYSRFLLISFSLSTIIFLLFPSCQNLRPAEFPRDNLLTRIVSVIYQADTNTNVFPSEHAIGALAVFAAAWNTERLHSPGRITAIGVLSVLICLSTVFLKQHSVLDVAGAAAICVFVYGQVYGRGVRRRG